MADNNQQGHTGNWFDQAVDAAVSESEQRGHDLIKNKRLEKMRDDIQVNRMLALRQQNQQNQSNPFTGYPWIAAASDGDDSGAYDVAIGDVTPGAVTTAPAAIEQLGVLIGGSGTNAGLELTVNNTEVDLKLEGGSGEGEIELQVTSGSTSIVVTASDGSSNTDIQPTSVVITNTGIGNNVTIDTAALSGHNAAFIPLTVATPGGGSANIIVLGVVVSISS